MSRDKRRRLESTVAAIQLQHGPRALRPAGELRTTVPPHIATGFPALDAATGCGGLPMGALTLFSGHSTSGKFTVACKALANAQLSLHTGAQGSASSYSPFSPTRTPLATVALLDLTQTADPDYLRRCGVHLSHLLIVRPEQEADGLPLLLDIVQSGQVRLLVVDGTAELAAARAAEGRRQTPPGEQEQRAPGAPPRAAGPTLAAAAGRLRQLARSTNTAVLFIDEPASPWQRWLGRDPAAPLRSQVALHIEMRRERWLRREGQLAGYGARAQILRSQWRSDTPSADLEITFNGTVYARPTW
jgi:RecA/RadA recombinase